MAFSMDGIIIDRIQMGVAETFDGDILYTLSQLADATIDITAESKDAVDNTGTLIKRFYTGKAGTFTAQNAILDFNIMAAATGSDKQIASSGAKIVAPKILEVKKGTETVEVKGLKEGTVRVEGLAENGTRIKTYTKDTQAATDKFSVAGTTITLPTDASIAKFVIKCDRDVEAGVKVANKANEFPTTIKLTLKALAVDPCSADTLRACYIVLPSFQVSPETSLSLTTDAQMEYKGDLQVDYCSADKTLYEIYFAEDDVE